MMEIILNYGIIGIIVLIITEIITKIMMLIIGCSLEKIDLGELQ